MIYHCLNVVATGKSLKFVLRNTVLFLYMYIDKQKHCFYHKKSRLHDDFRLELLSGIVTGLSSAEVRYINQPVIEEEFCDKLNYGGRLKMRN